LLFYKMLASTMQFSNNNPVTPRTAAPACGGAGMPGNQGNNRPPPPRENPEPEAALLPQDPTVCHGTGPSRPPRRSPNRPAGRFRTDRCRRPGNRTANLLIFHP